MAKWKDVTLNPESEITFTTRKDEEVRRYSVPYLHRVPIPYLP